MPQLEMTKIRVDSITGSIKQQVPMVILSSLILFCVNDLDESKTKFMDKISYISFFNCPVGKFILKISLAIIPIVGVLGASIGLYSGKLTDKKDVTVAMLGGFICWIIAFVLPFSSSQPISPWDSTKQ